MNAAADSTEHDWNLLPATTTRVAVQIPARRLLALAAAVALAVICAAVPAMGGAATAASFTAAGAIIWGTTAFQYRPWRLTCSRGDHMTLTGGPRPLTRLRQPARCIRLRDVAVIDATSGCGDGAGSLTVALGVRVGPPLVLPGALLAQDARIRTALALAWPGDEVCYASPLAQTFIHPS